MWAIAVSFRTKNYRTVSCGKEQYHIRQSSVMWNRAALCGTEKSHKVMSSFMRDIAVSDGTNQS